MVNILLVAGIVYMIAKSTICKLNSRINFIRFQLRNLFNFLTPIVGWSSALVCILLTYNAECRAKFNDLDFFSAAHHPSHSCILSLLGSQLISVILTTNWGIYVFLVNVITNKRNSSVIINTAKWITDNISYTSMPFITDWKLVPKSLKQKELHN